MRVFKILRRKGRKHYSLSVEEKYRVEYAKGKWAVPLVGKLFCFTSFDRAREYFDTLDEPEGQHLELWVCETAEKPANRPSAVSRSYFFPDYWEGKVTGLWRTPPGTKVVSSLMPIQRVMAYNQLEVPRG